MNDLLRLRDSRLEWREVEGQVLALDLSDSRYLLVNRSGAVLWEPLREGSTREALVLRLVNEFGIDRERAGKDVGAFLDELDRRDLLVRD